VDGNDAVSHFELYRYTHADGTAKEWAWRGHPDAGIEVRWGRAGKLVQTAVYPPSRHQEVIERALAKQRKGYRFVGWCQIDDAGKPFDVRGRSAGPSHVPPRPKPHAAAKPASAPLPDLSAVETGSDDYWF
jgi:hypothetical protein